MAASCIAPPRTKYVLISHFRLSVVEGSGSGLHGTGSVVPIEAGKGWGHYRFSHWTMDSGGAIADALASRTAFAMPSGPATVLDTNQSGSPSRS